MEIDKELLIEMADSILTLSQHSTRYVMGLKGKVSEEQRMAIWDNIEDAKNLVREVNKILQAEN